MPFRRERCNRARCASAALPASPLHASSAGSCKARPYENDSRQGSGASRFIASRLAVASEGVWPPDRKKTPGTAAGTVRLSTCTVCMATSAAAVRPHALPGSTMLGFSSMCSSTTACRCKAWKTSCSTASDTSAQRAMVCAPSISTSGSTIGTTPAS
ncbi:hypothetical protein D3C86_1671020 [compost metagenome]